MATTVVILPPLPRVAGIAPLPRLLGRGDRLANQPPGLLAVLAAAFGLPAASMPVAALLRESAAHDAGTDAWLCADPAFVQAEPAGARLMACGAMGLSAEEADALARPLRPLLGDAGALLETTFPDRWQLRLAQGRPLPPFATPEAVLGTPLLQHLPAGVEARSWRALFNEVQIVLHQHPRNRERAAAGLPPVNALWFWGGGALPAAARTKPCALVSADPVACALAAWAQVPVHADAGAVAGQAGALVDLGDAAADAAAAWLARAVSALRGADVLEAAFVDGARWRFHRSQRWRIWRRPWLP